MQFNDYSIKGSSTTAIEMMKSLYENAGYQMPKIVFWNLRTSSGVPEKADAKDVALVSGFSPSLMTSLLAGKDFTPKGIMKEAVWKERYLIC